MISSAIFGFVILVATTVISVYLAGRRRNVDMTEWAVGNRSFGAVMLWFLSAGEIYTTFAFLGASGWTYSFGVPGFYVMANAPLGYVLGYWLLPKIWSVSKRHNIYSQGEYARLRFGQGWLAVMFAVVAILALIPYVQLQFTGLSLIMQVLFNGAVSKTLTVLVAAVLALSFTFTAGLRSTALAAIVKDTLVLIVVIGIGLSMGAVLHLGSIPDIFQSVAKKFPDHMSLATKSGYTPWWFMSTILLTNVGYWMWPHQFQATCSARDADTIRRNAVFQPLYTLAYFFIFAIGFAALLVVPHLSNGDAALVQLVSHAYPRWFLGLVAGAGMLVAVVPCSALLLTLGTVFSQNIFARAVRRETSDRQRLLAARIAVLVAVAIAVYFTLHSSSTIVGILLVAYGAISQLGPGIILSMLWRRITAYGAAAGLVVGIIGVGVPPVTGWFASISPLGVNPDFTALVANVVVTVVISLLTPAPAEDAVAVGVPEATEPIPNA